ncbi:hypothetical protein SLS62_007406 [Diatrype stigma]|uniref:Peroxisomal membrane protein PEX17 n=1 Tax=Diatrype stigma TaxID=117547 RepID=A0AAN9UPD8_9PEZI
MPADRMLATVLRAYQDPPNAAQTDAIFGTTATLLSSLNNPLNLSLLTSHFLTARAIWQPSPVLDDNGLQTCLRIISVYNTAASHVRRNEIENSANAHAHAAGGGKGGPQQQQFPPTVAVGSGVSSEEWARAVAKGADDRSARWQHCLVLTGVLMGMEGEERRTLSRSLRWTLAQAVVTAANLALEDPARSGPLGSGAVVLALTYAFPLLSDYVKRSLDCDALLPAIVWSMTGHEGFQRGEFLRAIAGDAAPERNVWWPANSPSMVRLQHLVTRPLVQNMGPLTRLADFAIQHAKNPNIVLEIHDELLTFTAELLEKWELCPLSGIDLSTEMTILPPDVLQGPWGTLWQLLKKIMYTVVAALQPILRRALLDPYMRHDFLAPAIASKTLHALRNLAFVSSRQNAGSFQVYTFTYLTSLDIITRYPDACVAFLEDTLPPAATTQSPQTPPPLAQALTLFYLNTAEHLPLSVPTPACETLMIGPAAALLAPTSWLTQVQQSQSRPPQPPAPALALELFEAAHSCVLSALSCPEQHGALTAPLVPFYVDALLASFPARVAPRQFRLAFRTVAQVVSPPFPIAASHPDLGETLLEMLLGRATTPPGEGGASTAPLDDHRHGDGQADHEEEVQAPPSLLSEQTTLLLALVDAIPYLAPPAVAPWLTRAAAALRAVPDPAMRDVVRRRLWDVLAAGELDVERAAVGVAWWGVGGGREMVLFGDSDGNRGSGGGREEFMMSGALGGAGAGEEKERSML